MHWEALTFYIEPRELILGGYAIIGVVTAEISDCSVEVKGIEHAKAGVDALIKAVKQGFKLHTAYPSMYMDSVMYFLGRLGIPRLSLRVVDADPRAMPFRAFNDVDVVRNIAYLHVVKEIALRG
ncbi:hypothetical protein [Vulcanisaeta distributa]|uniref:hypothetical protein n=1 Tax=Vulcanisaeta distributa TaxID=164451 RepID=UPI0006D1A816|nr:hypothetical protein [Vulcanisaeta distributa]